MSSVLDQARKRAARNNDSVTVVLWDKDNQTGKRMTMAYDMAHKQAAKENDSMRYETRIILIPAYGG